MTRRIHRGRRLPATLLLLVASCLLWPAGRSAAATVMNPEAHPQLSWAACNLNANTTQPSTFAPLSDAQAAALVTHQPETRVDNATPYKLGATVYPAPNVAVPTSAQLAAVRAATTSTGQSILSFNPYYAYVDGRDGMSNPSTDDLIQWAAHKWGIPENWLRAQYVKESYWNQYALGDDTAVGSAWYSKYPFQARVPGSSTNVYQSMGIAQVRWAPDGSLNPGSEPLRWISTAFNIDWQAATVRFYYDNPRGARKAWNDASYRPCQTWNSIGGWYSPYPWANAAQQSYITSVQQILTAQTWTSATFRSWTPPSMPPGITLL